MKQPSNLIMFQGEILTNIEHEIICQDDARKAIAILLERGCKNVIMTMGSSGCMLASQENRTPVHVKCPQVETVDTTVSKYKQN